jgi:plastocyanin
VVRFTLGTGVHNVHFLADSNPGKQGLPPASDMLQIPGQTYDLKVTLAPGTYYYQCDPHALLGMKGHLTVKE